VLVWKRSAATALVAGLVALSVFVGGEPALADSSQGLAQNMWMVEAFEEQGYATSAEAQAYAKTTANVADKIANGPVAPVASDAGNSLGLWAKAKGVLGSFLNLGGSAALEVGALGTAGLIAANLPSPQATGYVPGWDSGNVLTYSGGTSPNIWHASVTVGVLSEPAYGATSGTVTIAYGVSGCPSGTAPSVWGYRLLSNGTFTTGSHQVGFNFGPTPLGGTCTPATPVTYSPSASYPWYGIAYTAGGGQVITYRPAGSPSRVDEPDAMTAPRTITNTVECQGADGSTWSGSSSVTFTIAGLAAGQSATVPEVNCPTNMWATKVTPKITTTTPSGPSDTPLSQPLTPSTTITTRAPHLIDGTDTGLQLVHVTSTGDEPCEAGPEACRYWGQDPNKDNDYKCLDGGVAVALSKCDVLVQRYNPPADPAGDPSGDGQECFPSGWGLMNPVEWVYMPVRCALVWAFVPDGDVIGANVGTVQTALTNKPPFSLLVAAQPVITGLTSGWASACSSRVSDFDPWHEGRLAIPCTPPASAPLTALYALAVAALVISTAFYVWHMLVAAIGGNDGDGGNA